jgi:hypothetical protein
VVEFEGYWVGIPFMVVNCNRQSIHPRSRKVAQY